MTTLPGRLTVDNSDGLVVFLIGVRIHKWWLLPIALPILSGMQRMLAELAKDPELGLLGVQSLGFGGTVQYWKSVEHLQRYANDRDRVHKPTWKRFMEKLFKNGAVGIWHETYIVEGGRYESIYTNMPKFGLGVHKELIPAAGARNTARARLGEGD